MRYPRNIQRTMERVELILQREGRYEREAYLFVWEAFVFTRAKLGTRRGLAGGDLLEGIKNLALERYGPTARLVFEHWGVRSTEDFGRIVFHMVEAGIMRKAQEDTIEDFKDVFDFREEFEKKFKFRVDQDSL